MTVTPAGETGYTYPTPPNTATSALEVPGGASRIASVWYSATSFTVDVDVTNGQSYNLELYVLDYNGGNGRSEKVQLSNAGTGTVLNTESVSAFSGGDYLDYTISGNVLITITRTAGANAVLNGLFFDSVATGGVVEPPGKGDGGTTNIPAVDVVSELSTANTASDSGNAIGGVPSAMPRTAMASSAGAAIGPVEAAVDLVLEAVPDDPDATSLIVDTPTHDLALEQILESVSAPRLSRGWGLDA